jgi:hypothetical protein
MAKDDSSKRDFCFRYSRLVFVEKEKKSLKRKLKWHEILK